MRSRSFTSSFDPRRSALPWLIAIVAALEVLLNRVPDRRLATDNLLDTERARLERPIPDPDIPLVLGDSVARQLTDSLRREGRVRFNAFTTVGALETSGNYCLWRRYLDVNPPPKCVVFMHVWPHRGALRNSFVENYVNRGFLKTREIAWLSWGKRDPVQAARMLLYRAFASYRHRRWFQQAIPGFLRRQPGGAPAMPPMELSARVNDLTRALDFLLRRGPERAGCLSERMFRRWVAEADALGCTFVYLPTPQRGGDRPATRPLAAGEPELDPILAELLARYPHFRCPRETRLYPADWYQDWIHLKPAHVPAVAHEFERAFNEGVPP